MRGRLLLVALLCAAAAPAGCGSEADGAGGKPRGDRLLVRFRWSGGLAGRHDVLRIDRSGRGRLRAGPPGRRATRRVRLSSRSLRLLRRAVAAARIPSLHGLAPPAPVPDGFLYRIAVPGGAVTFGDGGPTVPRTLGRLTARLRGIVEDAERRHGAVAAAAPVA
jgi:hypothetical protein